MHEFLTESILEKSTFQETRSLLLIIINIALISRVG